MNPITVETVRDVEARKALLDDLARLRITVFREWPYLYEGSLDYEQRYLRDFLDNPQAALIIARDGDEIVGAATASAMAGQDEAVRLPFEQRGMDISTLYYFGESVLRPDYRGQRIGHAFFDAREAAAREAGASAACFCAVIRPQDHALRPAGARDLAGFWRKRGYAPMDGLIATYAWHDIDQAGESQHDMQFWYRAL